MSFLKYRRSVRWLEYVLLWCAYEDEAIAATKTIKKQKTAQAMTLINAPRPAFLALLGSVFRQTI